MATLTARIPDIVEHELDEVAKEENIDRSTVVRKLLQTSLAKWREERAVKLYSRKVFSTEQAAKYARVTLWRFFELLREHNVFLSYDEEELGKDLKAIGWKKR